MWTSQSKSNPLNAGGSPLMLPAGPASNDKTAPEVGEDASGYLHLSVVQDSIQRWNVLSSLLEPLPKPSPRVLSFASQSKGLSGSDNELASISEGPISTIGVRLQGTVIDEILPWGPAHLSEQIMIRDEIIEVDGNPVTSDNVVASIIGADDCNSIVNLTLKKSDGSGIAQVRLARMLRPLLRIAEDLFDTLIKLRNMLSKVAPETISKLEHALDAVSALQIGNFDDRQGYLEMLTSTFRNQYLLDVHKYVDQCEQEIAQMHTDMKFALTQLQVVGMNPPPACNSDELETAMIVQRAFADEMRAEIESIRKSEARELDEMRRANLDNIQEETSQTDVISQLKQRLENKEEMVLKERDMYIDELLQQVSKLENQSKRLSSEKEAVLQESHDRIATLEAEVEMEGNLNDNLRTELNLKAPLLEDLEVEMKELKRQHMLDRQQIEKSDKFVGKLQAQIAAQQLRMDELQEKLIAERDRAAILEGQRRILVEKLGQLEMKLGVQTLNKRSEPNLSGGQAVGSVHLTNVGSVYLSKSAELTSQIDDVRTRMAQLQQTTLARRERDKEKGTSQINGSQDGGVDVTLWGGGGSHDGGMAMSTERSTGRATEREFLEKAMLTAPAHLLAPIPPLPKKTEKEVGKEWGVDEITHYA